MIKLFRRNQPAMAGHQANSLAASEDSTPRIFSGTWIAAILAAIAFLLSVHFGIQYAVRALLVQHAHSTGMDWAHHIEARTPTLADIVESDSRSDGKRAPSSVEFTNMINGMLSVGNIYQVDVINPDCYCDISLGTYAAKQSGAAGVGNLVHTHSHGDSGHGGSHGQPHLKGTHNTTKAPPKGVVQHVFESSGLHQSRSLFGDSDNRFALDRAFLQKIAKNLSHDIVLHNSNIQTQPHTFAEVYHSVTVGGKLSYILRVMVDLEEESVRFAATLYAGAAIVLLILLIAFAYPATKYLRTSTRQREADQEAHFLANHDVMTGVSNRNAFHGKASKILQSCLARNKSAAIFLFDLDNFKEVNDYHSQDAGDLVICALAEKLKEIAPEGSQIARLGGDEFAMIIGGFSRGDIEVTEIIDIPESVRVPIDDNRQIIETNISAGIVRFPRDGGNLEELMRNADMALHAAKAGGGGYTVEYDAQMSIEFYERLDLRDEFRDALERSQIVPFYQPLVNMKTGQVEGFEALARWDHPSRGILTPYVFEEMLSDRELGAMVGSLMFKKIVEDMKRWKSTGVAFESVGLNVGEGDLLQPGFALNIISELVSSGLQPNNLAIEVTETCMFGSNSQAFINQLEHLRRAGCYIALDDFGTGFSSITQVKQLPCSAVKIDKSFVNEVVNDKADQSIIQSLLELGQKLGFKLVLEGVETLEQLDLLKSLGCEIAQGYHYSRPVPASEVPALIQKLNGSTAKRDRIRIVA